MSVEEYLVEFGELLKKIDPNQVRQLEDAITECYRTNRFVFLIGNGGSGSNASHMCEDLGKSTLTDFENQKRLKVLSLTDNTPYILAWANDTSYERIFVEQLKNFAEPGALLVAISGSGNSKNVLRAVEWANAHAMKTFAMCGYDGGQLKRMAQASLHVPSFNMGMVESVHLTVFHQILDTLRERFRKSA